jgi:excisionase family DNA binding protein
MNNPFEILENKLSNIESLLLDIKHNSGPVLEPPEADPWFNLKEFCKYHPDKPALATVYGWISDKKVPYHKSGKKLRFLKSEIDAWLLANKKDTLANATDLYLNKKGLNNGK